MFVGEILMCFMTEYMPRTYQGQYIIYCIFIMLPLYIYIFKSEFCQQIFRVGDLRLMV